MLNMAITNGLLMAKVSDGDLHTRMKGILYPETLQEIVTIGDMVEYYRNTEVHHAEV